MMDELIDRLQEGCGIGLKLLSDKNKITQHDSKGTSQLTLKIK